MYISRVIRLPFLKFEKKTAKTGKYSRLFLCSCLLDSVGVFKCKKQSHFVYRSGGAKKSANGIFYCYFATVFFGALFQLALKK